MFKYKNVQLQKKKNILWTTENVNQIELLRVYIIRIHKHILYIIYINKYPHLCLYILYGCRMVDGWVFGVQKTKCSVFKNKNSLKLSIVDSRTVNRVWNI